MKFINILLIASSVLAFAACNDLNELNEGQPIEKNRTTIVASIDVPDLQTKTYMGYRQGDATLGQGTYPVLWSEGDKIALISGAGNSIFTIDDSDDVISTDKDDNVTSGPGTQYAKFSGSADQIVDPFPNTMVYPAAYPASKAFAETTGGTIWVGSEIPLVQEYKPAKGFADNVYPMAAATIDPAHYHFYNMAGIIRLKIYCSDTNEHRISRITIRNNAHKPMSGRVAMEFNSETGAVIESDGKDNGKTVKAYKNADGSDGSENVIIDLSGIVEDLTNPDATGITLPTTVEGALVFNVAIIPQMFPKGFSVDVQDATNLGTTTWISVNDITVNRSEIKEMEPMNYVQPEALGIANCFQLSDAGEYLLPAYAYGNRMDIRIGNADEGFNPDDLDAAIYWTDIVDESGNTLNPITNLQYLKFANGINFMSFKVAKDPHTQSTLPDGTLDPDSGQAYRGNVVIALYNPSNGTIFWTWHMWLCDTPKDVVIDGACAAGSYHGTYPDGTPLDYEADATSGNMIIMDRNLGAIYATPEECPAGESWKTYGLYYQDGRKDPFIGGNYNGSVTEAHNLPTAYDEVVKNGIHKFEDEPFTTGTHMTWTNPIFLHRMTGGSTLKSWIKTDGNLTLTNSIRDPQNYSFDKSDTWQWTDCDDPDNKSWMTADNKDYAKFATHGNTGLSYGGHEAYWNRTKTIMDPCPPGYSVLGERGGYFFAGKGSKEWRYSDSAGYGLMYTYNGTAIWWPAAGVRSCEGLMAGVGEYGYYFFYDHITADHGGHGVIFQTGPVKGTDGKFLTESNKDAIITNHATPVRCVKDKQGDYAVRTKAASLRISPVN